MTVKMKTIRANVSRIIHIAQEADITFQVPEGVSDATIERMAIDLATIQPFDIYWESPALSDEITNIKCIGFELEKEDQA